MPSIYNFFMSKGKGSLSVEEFKDGFRCAARMRAPRVWCALLVPHAAVGVRSQNGVQSEATLDAAFAAFDQDGDGTLSFEEVVCGLALLTSGSMDDRIRVAFSAFDVDKNGVIDQRFVRARGCAGGASRALRCVRALPQRAAASGHGLHGPARAPCAGSGACCRTCVVRARAPERSGG